jgi:hypothetical protein
VRAHIEQDAGSVDDAGPAARLAASAPLVARVLALQRGAGNRATRALLQRELQTRPRDLDPLLGSGGKLKAAVGKSTFAAVRGALVDYRKALKAKQGRAQREALQLIEQRAIEWLNVHARSADPLDQRRRAALTGLLDDVAAERAALGRGQAQQRYLSNVQERGEDKPHGLKLLTQAPMPFLKSQRIAANAAAAAANITNAELAAIQIFSQDDYKYINPATAASPTWLAEANRRILDTHSEQLLIEEGTLHTGVALQGLLKLPVHEGRTYRGERRTDPDLYKVGQVVHLLSLVSTSKALDRAEYFASQGTAEEFPVRFVFEYNDHGGRDIEVMSTQPQEREVLVLPGSRFVVESITDIPIPAAHAKTKAGTEWRMVKLRGVRQADASESSSGE